MQVGEGDKDRLDLIKLRSSNNHHFKESVISLSKLETATFAIELEVCPIFGIFS